MYFVIELKKKKKTGKQATTHQDAGDFTLSPRKGSVKRQLSRTTALLAPIRPEFAEECFLTEPKAFSECECKGDDDDDEVVWLG